MSRKVAITPVRYLASGGRQPSSLPVMAMPWSFPVAAPINRIADPAEIAAAVVYLASDKASLVTGHAMNVDGGLMAW